MRDVPPGRVQACEDVTEGLGVLRNQGTRGRGLQLGAIEAPGEKADRELPGAGRG